MPRERPARRMSRRDHARSAAFLGAVVLASLGVPGPADAQEESSRFSSFDVGIGAVLPDRADVGLSYGVGFDVANLPASGLAARFGFRFWSATDEPAGVDLDDGVLEVLVKAHLESGGWRGYAGAGLGAHFVSARLSDAPEIQDPRDGFRPGLQLLLGTEMALGRDDFLAAFVEGTGSVVSDLSHGTVQAGVRVRFDRLGGS